MTTEKLLQLLGMFEASDDEGMALEVEARAELDALLATNRTQYEAIMRTWFVLKKHNAHPGRTDDLIDECVDRALTSLDEQRDHWMNRRKVWRERAEKAEARFASLAIEGSALANLHSAYCHSQQQFLDSQAELAAQREVGINAIADRNKFQTEYLAAMELLRQTRASRDELAGRLAELQRQEPVAEVVPNGYGTASVVWHVKPYDMPDAKLYDHPVVPQPQDQEHLARSAGEGGDAVEGQS